MRTLDAMASIPLLIWAVALVGILGVGPVHIAGFTFGNEVKLLALLGLLYIPTLARITYTTALGEAGANYVAARRLQGVSVPRIMLSDVLPNCLSPVIVQATLLLAIGIVIEASVSFVGLACSHRSQAGVICWRMPGTICSAGSGGYRCSLAPAFH